MAVAAPLIIPAAEAIWAAIVIVGGAITAAVVGNEAKKAIDRTFPTSIPTTITQCPNNKCDDPECLRIIAKIQAIQFELRQRYLEMRLDSKNLYPVRPLAILPFGSWPGHILQYKQKQASLRRQINDASTRGCPIPPGAWQDASREPPSYPDLKGR